MRIGYRRWTGPAWESAEKIRGARGQWFEKRVAFINLLRSKGHTVEIIKQNPGDSTYRPDDALTWDQDTIFMEFASTNEMFHKRYLDVSRAILKDRAKDTIFLMDDPDLFPDKDNVVFKDVWVNAENAEACTAKFKRHCTTFPVYGLQTRQEPTREHNGKVVYYGGTSCSREKKLIALQSKLGDKLMIYGAQKDYKVLKVNDPPKQAERAGFYRQFAASINLNDNIHKQLQWNTGRKYHSILAGCPSFDENDRLVSNLDWAMHQPEFRAACIAEQQQLCEDAKLRCHVLINSVCP